jgi:hypothetical protein
MASQTNQKIYKDGNPFWLIGVDAGIAKCYI